MIKQIKLIFFTLSIPALSLISPTIVQAQDADACPYNSSRSGLCGRYHSEISPAEAYLNTVVNRKHSKWSKHGHSKHQPQAVILDVRSTPEYRAGHPEYAYNTPFPYIYQYCDEQGRKVDGACYKKTGQIDQPVADFVNYVESRIPDKDTPIYTLCRTGVRSVAAANALTDAGYTQVRNIWEGFVGINLMAPFTDENGNSTTIAVDLNHDNVVDDNDKNGWRNHQALPYDTHLSRKLIYQPAAETYDWE